MRRRKGRAQGDLGMPLADILTTALGCVLLIFIVVVLQIKTRLSAEQRAHSETREQQLRAEAERTASKSAEVRSSQALMAAKGEVLALQEELAKARARYEASVAHATSLHNAVKEAVDELDPRTASPVDVLLVVDGTNSMHASLNAVRTNLKATIGALHVVSPTARVGVVVFRDEREEPVLRLESHPLTEDIRSLSRFLEGVKATSTEVDTDLPEWLCGAMEFALASAWRSDAIKLMVVVSDAADQDPSAARCLTVARDFRAQGGRVHVVSTRPSGYPRNRSITRSYEDSVLPQHERIAREGSGAHLRSADADALLVEVLEAAFRSRTEQPVDRLRSILTEVEPSPSQP